MASLFIVGSFDFAYLMNIVYHNMVCLVEMIRKCMVN
nr:MAG TPA: hypothetical protein [Caudoviricetes sp.]